MSSSNVVKLVRQDACDSGLPLCKDCAHYRGQPLFSNPVFAKCGRAKRGPLDMVTGRGRLGDYWYCLTARESDCLCGRAGRFWAPRAPSLWRRLASLVWRSR